MHGDRRQVPDRSALAGSDSVLRVLPRRQRRRRRCQSSDGLDRTRGEAAAAERRTQAETDRQRRGRWPRPPSDRSHRVFQTSGADFMALVQDDTRTAMADSVIGTHNEGDRGAAGKPDSVHLAELAKPSRRRDSERPRRPRQGAPRRRRRHRPRDQRRRVRRGAAGLRLPRHRPRGLRPGRRASGQRHRRLQPGDYVVATVRRPGIEHLRR